MEKTIFDGKKLSLNVGKLILEVKKSNISSFMTINFNKEKLTFYVEKLTFHIKIWTFYVGKLTFHIKTWTFYMRKLIWENGPCHWKIGRTTFDGGSIYALYIAVFNYFS